LIACELQLREGALGEIHFSFVLINIGRKTITLSYYYPFLDFTLQITAAGQALQVEEPEYDIPVKPVEHLLPPGQSLTLHTPATLRFAAVIADVREDFYWIIHSPSQPINITATLLLEAQEPMSCSKSWGG
jgi:hypothetical protein